MDDMSSLEKWLNITEQQMLILSIIKTLKATGQPSSPKNICAEFKKSGGKQIQKSNLFTQMRALFDRGFIAKDGKADYSIVPEAIKTKLTEKRTELIVEVSRIDKMQASPSGLISSIISKGQETQDVEYLDHDSLFEALERKLKFAKEFYVSSKFPNLLMTYAPYKTFGRGKYRDVLVQRCFEEKQLKVTLITQLSVPYIFERSLIAHDNNADAAYRECEFMIGNLGNVVKSYDNLDVRCPERPFGFDTAIPITDTPSEFFMFIRDDHDAVIGGIHLKSEQIAKKAYEQFMKECELSKHLTSDSVNGVMSELLSKLKEERDKYVCKGGPLKTG